MFCDLVGSTALASRLDPEDLRRVMIEYQDRVTSVVARFGGFVARYMGDGVLVYFGWPVASEADAESAVRGGLAAAAAVAESPIAGEALQVRIGIATGLVVVGDLIGNEATQEQTVLGETPNLASRLQTLAEPGTVAISNATQAQIAGLFDCESLGETALKGFSQPVRAWRAVRERTVRSRFEALRAAGLTRLVDREAERAFLEARWREATERRGSTVLISGEAGIGKSRLVAALADSLERASHTRVRLFCSPYHQDSALYPVMGQLAYAAGFHSHDASGEKLRKLQAMLAETRTPEEEVALLADLLSLPIGNRSPWLQMSSQRKKEKTLEALRRQLTQLAAVRPVLTILEDMHWADPTTLDLLDLVVGRISDLPILLVMTFRPEFQPRWIGLPAVRELSLGRLTRPQAAAIVTQIGGAPQLTSEILNRIVDQTEGIPLFIEELTKSAVEARSGGHDAGGTISIPPTLQASLMARLDRLPAAKQVAQIGAVIGREFSHELLAAVAPLAEPVLEQGLTQLLAANLLLQQGNSPDLRYVFKHALLQDAVYESMLRSSRAQFHARIAEALPRVIPDAEAAWPGVLAHHCAHAGLIERAARYYRLAGEQSIARSAMTEARAHLERGLRVLAPMPDSEERRAIEAGLLLALGTVCVIAQGYGGTEIAGVVERAVTIARSTNDNKLLTRALFGEWAYRSHIGDLTGSLGVALEMLARARRADDARARIVATTSLGMNRMFAGEFEEAARLFEDCLRQLGSERVERFEGPDPQDHETLARAFLSLALACLGRLEESAVASAKSIDRARRLDHRPSLAVALTVGCRQAWLLRDENLLNERAGELVTLCEEQGFPYWLARGRCFLGLLAAARGDAERSTALMEGALAELNASGVVLWNINGLIAEADLLLKNHAAAQAHLDEALRTSSRTGEVWIDADLHRLKSTLLLETGGGDSAERSLQQALQIAQSQSARLFELRAAVNLARLWAQQGRAAEARGLLVPIRNGFRSVGDARDLQDANAVLREIALSPP